MYTNGYRLWRDLNDLPDNAVVALRWLVGGIALLLVRFGWPYVAPSSFRTASIGFLHYFGFLYRNPSQDAFGVVIIGASVLCSVSGAFIFFRRGFWWVAEHRKDSNITELKFK